VRVWVRPLGRRGECRLPSSTLAWQAGSPLGSATWPSSGVSIQIPPGRQVRDGCRPCRAAADRAIARLGRQPVLGRVWHRERGRAWRPCSETTTWPSCGGSIEFLHTLASPRDPLATSRPPNSPRVLYPALPPDAVQGAPHAHQAGGLRDLRRADEGPHVGAPARVRGLRVALRGPRLASVPNPAGRARPGADARAALAGAWLPDGRPAQGPPRPPRRLRRCRRPPPARQLQLANPSRGGRGALLGGGAAARGDPPPSRPPCRRPGPAAEHPHDAPLVCRAAVAGPGSVSEGVRIAEGGADNGTEDARAPRRAGTHMRGWLLGVAGGNRLPALASVRPRLPRSVDGDTAPPPGRLRTDGAGHPDRVSWPARRSVTTETAS
jgi:hypothetical protein